MSSTALALSYTTVDDPLYPAAELLPLGRPLGAMPIATTPPTSADRRPFGLRFATIPVRSIPAGLTSLRYDADRQICVDATGTPVYGKHSTGQTSTRTSDGHQSMDSDTDHTED